MSEPDDEERRKEVFKERPHSKFYSFIGGLFGFGIIDVLLSVLIGPFVLIFNIIGIIYYWNRNKYVMFGIVSIFLLLLIVLLTYGACNTFS